MIKVSPTSKKAVHDFNDQAWHSVDIEHFGKQVTWKEYTFRFKATKGERVVGTISGKCYPGVVYVFALIVDAQERGKGVGKALIAQAEEYGRKHGAHKVTLETGVDWQARKFYDSLGYKVEAELPNHYFHHDFVIYAKFLA